MNSQKNSYVIYTKCIYREKNRATQSTKMLLNKY